MTITGALTEYLFLGRCIGVFRSTGLTLFLHLRFFRLLGGGVFATFLAATLLWLLDSCCLGFISTCLKLFRMFHFTVLTIRLSQVLGTKSWALAGKFSSVRVRAFLNSRLFTLNFLRGSLCQLLCAGKSIRLHFSSNIIKQILRQVCIKLLTNIRKLRRVVS